MNINFSCIYLRVKLCAMDVRVQSSGEGEGGRERRGQKAGEGRKWRKQRRGKQGREERRGGEENVPSAICSPNCCNDQIWAKLKSVVWNSITVPHMCDSSPNTSVTFAASRGTWAVDLMERTHVGSNRHECSFDPLFHKACVVCLSSIYLFIQSSIYLPHSSSCCYSFPQSSAFGNQNRMLFLLLSTSAASNLGAIHRKSSREVSVYEKCITTYHFKMYKNNLKIMSL